MLPINRRPRPTASTRKINVADELKQFRPRRNPSQAKADHKAIYDIGRAQEIPVAKTGAGVRDEAGASGPVQAGAVRDRSAVRAADNEGVSRIRVTSTEVLEVTDVFVPPHHLIAGAAEQNPDNGRVVYLPSVSEKAATAATSATHHRGNVARERSWLQNMAIPPHTINPERFRVT